MKQHTVHDTIDQRNTRFENSKIMEIPRLFNCVGGGYCYINQQENWLWYSTRVYVDIHTFCAIYLHLQFLTAFHCQAKQPVKAAIANSLFAFRIVGGRAAHQVLIDILDSFH